MKNKTSNILKAIVSAGIAALSIMSVGFTVFADEVDNRYNNLFEADTIDASYSDTNLAIDEEFMSLVAASESCTLEVPFYDQKDNWRCGPATALQTYDYFYNLKYGRISPVTLAQMTQNIGANEDVGTPDIDKMLEYLNSCGLGCNYKQMWVWNDSVTYYTNQVCKAIDAGVPVIVWVKSPYSTSPLGYTTPGHLMNISGYKESGASLRLTDPYLAGHGISTGMYYVSNTELENITNTISYYF